MPSPSRQDSHETVFNRTSAVIKDILHRLIDLARSREAITEREIMTNIMLATLNEIFPMLEHIKCLAFIITSGEPNSDLAREFGVEYLAGVFLVEVDGIVESLRHVRCWLITGLITPAGMIDALYGLLGSLPF
ncbi:hypothetical protein PENARI_c009G04679 [Penicillium arizonense]|uniref:Uncharacterized protein n=1 Tax=Penicillium arizonense TaxID=1835702 RepID=A0A1F5LI32_PENAI|nr:hypothetical protein PENARI_c009G04679 [Penicillium arizonense]OGE52680.1 hypothetical protein PENARI_c009G04679 [Penicillium arizonense]